MVSQPAMSLLSEVITNFEKPTYSSSYMDGQLNKLKEAQHLLNAYQGATTPRSEWTISVYDSYADSTHNIATTDDESKANLLFAALEEFYHDAAFAYVAIKRRAL